MEYKVVVEYDPETRHYTATVPGLPWLVVDAKSERSAVGMARKAISLSLEEPAREKGPPRTDAPRPLRAKIVSVRL